MGLALLILVVAGVAGFAFGWAARKDDARSYVEANRRYYEAQLAELAGQLQQYEPAPAPAAAPTTVVYVHVAAPAFPSSSYSQPRVIDAEALHELTGGAA